MVGNQKGYRTFRGANQQANGKSKLNSLLWMTFENRQDKTDNLINSIKLMEK